MRLKIEPRRTAIHHVTRACVARAGLGPLYLIGVHLFHDLYVEWALARLKGAAEARLRAPG